MTRRLVCALLLAALAAGCGAEGGVTGTGIASSVSGNVVAVSADAAAPPFPIRVTVDEAPAVTAVTAADGAFDLSGRFSGAVTLTFARADDGAPIGQLPLEVPAGSVTVLENIVIDAAAPPPDRVQPRAVRQLDVGGRLDMAECGIHGGTILVSDGAPRPRQFLVLLTADTQILSRDGAALACAALRIGRRVRVEGFLRLRTLTLVATTVIVAPAPAPPPGAPRRERFRGIAIAVDCEGGEIALAQATDGDVVRRRLRLTEASDIECGDPPRRCRCDAIAAGDLLRGTGTIFPRAPGLVVVDALAVLPGPRRDPPAAGDLEQPAGDGIEPDQP